MIGRADAQVPAHHQKSFPNAVDQLLGELAPPLQIEQQPFPLGDVGDREQDLLGRIGASQAAGIEQHDLAADPIELVLDPIVPDLLLLAQHLLEEAAQLRDVPLAAAELVKLAPDRVLPRRLELLQECGVGEPEAEVAVQHHKRLGDRRYDRLGECAISVSACRGGRLKGGRRPAAVLL